MASQDPHKGGDLSDMAATGTKMPNDAGDYNVVSSVPNETEKAENPAFHNNFLNSADPQGAVSNAVDMPRTTKDTHESGEVVTAAGETMPASIESKRLGMGEAGGPAAKGDVREARGGTKSGSEIERFASEGAGVDPVPGEEGEGQDVVRERKGI